MYKIYQVGPNETVDSIANFFGINVEDLKQINGIGDNMQLVAGTFLIIPDKKQNGFINYEIQKGDTMYGISKKYNVNLKNLFELNGLEESDYIYPGETLKIPVSNETTYTTKRGDTLESIAKELNTTVDQIIKQNIIYLLENQMIKI